MIYTLLAKKDGTTLVQHSWDVVAAARKILITIALPSVAKDRIQPMLEFSCVMHDIGKSHPIFQKRMAGEKDKQSFRHEVVSAWIVSQFFEYSKVELFAIITHHKGIVSRSGSDRGRLEAQYFSDFLDQWLSEYPTYVEEIPLLVSHWIKEFQISRVVHSPVLDNFSFPKSFASLLHASYQNKYLSQEERAEFALMRALLMAADHIASGRMAEALPWLEEIHEADFQPCDKITGQKFPFRQFQNKMGEIKGDALLHAPTGSGKTEAALKWIQANHSPGQRIFYVLPYTASINAMALRLGDVFGMEMVTALHSSTLDFFYRQFQEEESNDEREPARIAELIKTLNHFSKELFFPIKVSTPHQILKRVLFGKGWEFALVDFHRALFIFDEFHAYDPFLTGLIFNSIRLLKNHFHARILFLSATIPAFLEKLAVDCIYEDRDLHVLRPDPAHPSNLEILGRKRHSLHLREGKLNSARFEILNAVLAGKKTLVVVNNVRSAQEVYGSICGLVEGGSDFSSKDQQILLDNIELLHGGFNRRDRNRIETRITSSLPPLLLIATQAVEVSLDIDYDLAFIENAPIDALIQRFGRVNRKGLLTDGAGNSLAAPITLFHESIGNVKHIYSDYILVRTWETLRKFENKMISEEDLVLACNEVYVDGYGSDPSDREDFERAFENFSIRNFADELKAGDWLDWIEGVLEDKGLPIEVLCGNLLDEYDDFIAQKKYIDASQLTVRIQPWLFRKINAKGGMLNHERTGVYYSYQIEYDRKRGYREEESLATDL